MQVKSQSSTLVCLWTKRIKKVLVIFTLHYRFVFHSLRKKSYSGEQIHLKRESIKIKMHILKVFL